MASYSVFLKRSAAKELEEIGRPVDRQRLVERIQALAENPRPPGCEKLAGREDRPRIRQGDYRVLYAIDDEKRIVTVVKIANRRNVYRSDT
ncbi:MAG: type II toxin-antitoxin system RelE/ParE family toxin [Gemmatimonadota bacterium]